MQLHNRDIAENFHEKTFFISRQAVVAAFAYWINYQSPYEVCERIAPALNDINEYLKARIGDAVEDMEYQDFKDLISDDRIFELPNIAVLNRPKIDTGQSYVLVDRHSQPNPDCDIIDIGALSRNVFFMVLREQITQPI